MIIYQTYIKYIRMFQLEISIIAAEQIQYYLKIQV